MSNNHNSESGAQTQPLIADYSAAQPQEFVWASLAPPTPAQMKAELLEELRKPGVSAHEQKELLREIEKLTYVGMTPKERVRFAKKMFCDALDSGSDQAALNKLYQDLRNSENWLKSYTREKREPLKLEDASEVANDPPPAWAVAGIIPDSGIGTIYGPPKSFKSFLAMDLLAHISLGRPWFGRDVVERPCIYIPFEGRAGVPSRIKAWEQKNNRKALFDVVRTPFNLRDPEKRDELINVLGPADWSPVLCIDTLAAAGGAFDENSMKDMGEMISILQELQQRLAGSVVIAVHHSGKDSSKGMRGHSSLSGAVDFALECKRGIENTGCFEIALAKDGPQGTKFAFEMEAVGDSMVVSQSDAAEVMAVPPDIALTTVAARILEHGPISQRELIAQRGIIPEPKIKEAVRALREQGKVIAVGNGSATKLKWVEQ